MAKSKKLEKLVKDLPKEHWKDEPDAHDYPAANDFLTLVIDDAGAAALVKELKGTVIVRRKAKDLLRASRLPLLPLDNPHVRQDLGKVEDGNKLSPVLLVRGSLVGDVALTVADGYHRICASYHINEDADIPCRLAVLAPELESVAEKAPSTARKRASSGGRRRAPAASDGA